jgi:spore germination cell wall hydrolase CwlJ-like protein
MLSAAESRDAIARVAYAEASNQGDSGLAGVVYTVINRVIDGGFGLDVGTVLDAPGQFEPVLRVGTWRHLPARSAVEQAHIDTILNLALDGNLPDPTNGARYFQNPTLVGQRAAAGMISQAAVNFGGQKPTAVIKDHAFFDGGGTKKSAPATATLFVPDQTAIAAGHEGRSSTPGAQPSSLFVPLDR